MLISSKGEAKLIETDHRRGFYKNSFQNFLNDNSIEHYSRNSSIGAVLADGFNRTIRDLLKRPVFEEKMAIIKIFYLQ